MFLYFLMSLLGSLVGVLIGVALVVYVLIRIDQPTNGRAANWLDEPVEKRYF